MTQQEKDKLIEQSNIILAGFQKDIEKVMASYTSKARALPNDATFVFMSIETILYLKRITMDLEGVITSSFPEVKGIIAERTLEEVNKAHEARKKISHLINQ